MLAVLIFARALLCAQLNAGVRQHDVKYSDFIAGLHKSGMLLNRKVLAELAATEPYSFKAVVEVAKNFVPAKEELK